MCCRLKGHSWNPCQRWLLALGFEQQQSAGENMLPVPSRIAKQSSAGICMDAGAVQETVLLEQPNSHFSSSPKRKQQDILPRATSRNVRKLKESLCYLLVKFNVSSPRSHFPFLKLCTMHYTQGLYSL